MTTQFYEQALMDSNVIECHDIKTQIEQYHNEFNWDEFNKDIAEIDWQTVVSSLTVSNLKAEWVPVKDFGNQKVKSLYNSVELKQGNVFGIGMKSFNNTLLIKGLKSHFIQHDYKFGDEDQKNQLKQPICDIIQQHKEDSFNGYNKLNTFKITYQLFSQDQMYQSQEVIDQVKYLFLIQHVMSKQIVNSNDYIPSGFINEKYVNYSNKDIWELSVNMHVMPRYKTQEFNPFTIISCNEHITGVDDQQNLERIMNSVQMKQMDVVLNIDSCCHKKDKRNVIVYPKLQAINVVLPEVKDEFKHKKTGLVLSNL